MTCIPEVFDSQKRANKAHPVFEAYIHLQVVAKVAGTCTVFKVVCFLLNIG